MYHIRNMRKFMPVVVLASLALTATFMEAFSLMAGIEFLLTLNLIAVMFDLTAFIMQKKHIKYSLNINGISIATALIALLLSIVVL
jgi:hypothetical protein